jgi:hypothetical protein
MKPSKKSVGLVTWLGNGNFGTALQSFALHEKLRVLGYKVFYLQPFGEFKRRKSAIRTVLEGIGRLLSGSMIRNTGKTLKEKKLHRFQRNHYKIRRISTQQQFKALLAETDVFVTGSDQIWNTKYGFNPFMFLNFAGSVKRIAYASSIGTSYVPDEYKAPVKELLAKFKHIGVREKTAVEVLQKVVGRTDIRQVLDPTFLLSAEDWRNIAYRSEIEVDPPSKYIFCYLIGDNDAYHGQLADLKRRTGIDDVIVIPAVENREFSVEHAMVYDAADPPAFVRLIAQASFVCTDSFHATALSINPSKDFVEFLSFSDADSGSQNSRIYDLLAQFRLEDRLYSVEHASWAKPIDYEPVQRALSRDRSSSLDYLTNAIEN